MKSTKYLYTSIILFILFIIEAILVTKNISNSIDLNLELFFVNHRFGLLTTIFKMLSFIGGPIFLVLFSLVILIVKKTRKFAQIIIITLISSTVINSLLKNGFKRARPSVSQLVSESSYSFPSGHSMGAMSLYIVLILLIIMNMKASKKKNVTITFLGFMPILIGISRLYLGVHYVSDVIGGFLAGGALGFLLFFIYINLKDLNTSFKSRDKYNN